MMEKKCVQSLIAVVVCALALLAAEPQAWCATNSVYLQTNLVSNIPGLAQSTDPNLRNPWGNSFSATGPFWVADAGSNDSTLYQGTGSTVNARVVGVAGGPTGTIANATTDFVEANGRPGSFIFSTLSGSIYSWNASDTNAQQVATDPNASFTGLAFANNGSGNFLYAANVKGSGGIDVFNSTFARVNLAGRFVEPNLPVPGPFGTGSYVPYNIQNINGQLYVEYTNLQTGAGAVAIFDANGNFVKELIAVGEPHLNFPWGVVIAPTAFGSFGGDLLVGNFGNGQINAYDPTTGAFVGTVTGFNGPIVNSGLWSLTVRTGGTFDTSAVYFTAGINGQADGLFGKLTAATAATPGITTPTQLPAGRIGAAYTQTLAVTGGAAPYSNWKVSSGNLPPGLSLGTTTGILSGTPTAVSGTFNFMVSLSDTSGAAATAAFQLNIQPASTTATLSRVGSFAQVASGGGWVTSMTLINLTASTVNAQINLYADNGTPLVLPLTFPQFGTVMSASSVSLTLTPNDSIVIVSNSPSTAVGVGWADIQATGALTGYSTFAFSSSGGPTSEGTTTADTRLSSSMLLPYDNTNGFQTGVALANQSSAPQTITATLFDQTGTQLTTAQITLPAFGHTSFFVSSQFAQSAGKLGIIQFQSGGGVTGVGLIFSPTGAFTSIPIIR